MDEKNRVLLEKNKHWLYAFLIFAVTSFVFLSKSPLHPWVCGDAGTDSSVFKTVVLMMENGYMPYRDSFDHKGPLLYLINYVGNMISEYRGVWILEYISLFITLFVSYKTALLTKCGHMQAGVSVFVSWTLLFGYFDGGNMTEEYAMPFIAIALFIFMDYMINRTISKKRLFLCGFCFGGVCLLRANMIGVWITFCLVIFIKSIYEKQFIELLKFILWFLAGFSAISIPIILWLGINNSLSAFWFEYIVFNCIYTNASFEMRWSIFFVFLNTFVYILSIVATVFLSVKRNRFIYGSYLLYLLINLLTVSMSGMGYRHYGMILIPAAVLPIAGVFSCIDESKKTGEMVSFLAIAFLVCNVIAGDWIDILGDAGSLYAGRRETHYSDEVKSICEIIQNNTSEKDAISVYGNFDIIYVVSNRMHATKYSYQFPIGSVYPEIMNEYWIQLSEEKPKMIVIQRGHYYEDILSFLSSNGYDLLWTSSQELYDSDSVFIRYQ